MSDKERVIDAVFSVIREINADMDPADRIEESPDVELYGEKAALDSLGLVKLVVGTEQKIEEEFGVTIEIAGESAMSAVDSPFRTVETMVDHIMRLLAKGGRG